MYKPNNTYSEFISKREAIIASLDSLELTLKFLWKNPENFVIENFEKTPFFQLYFKNDIMFLLLKFQDLKWVDIPCFFNENTKNLFSSEENCFPCRILLANSNTGKLYINKLYTMPNGITKAFIQGIHTQKSLSKKVVIERINAIRASYSAQEMSRLSLGKFK